METAAQRVPRIREAQSDDRAPWLRMRRALWPDCPEDKHALEIGQLLQSDGAVLVAEDEQSRLLGFAEVSLRHDHVDGASISPVPYLEGWFVEPGFRGRGVGRALIAAVEQWAIAKGFTELASDAELSNTRSIELHARLGFAEVERNVTCLKKLARR
jgi:aminoglycoside 6'-N-acetyltransferase I